MCKKIVSSPITYGLVCLGLVLFLISRPLAMLVLRHTCELCPPPAGSVPEALPLVDADGVLYTVAHQTLFAFEETSGKLLWHSSQAWLNPVQPVVSQGVLYLSVTLREQSDGLPYRTWVEAFRASSGQVLWRTRLSSSSTPLFPPVPQVLAGIVYAQVSDRATLFALRASDGQVLWHQDADGSPLDTVRLLFATPGMAYLNAYHDPAGQLLARRSSDGAVLWQYAPPSCFPVDGSLLAGRLYLSDSCQGAWGETVALQAETGQLLWRFSPGGYLTATREVVYVTETADSSSGVDRVYAVDAATGHLRWQRVSARGGAGEAHLWAATAEAVYATMHGIWYALAARDGKTVWQFPPPGSTELGPVEGTLLSQMQSWVVSGQVVYLYNGLLQALDAGTGTVLWTFSAQSVEALGAEPVALSAGIIYLSGLAQDGDAQAVVSHLQPQAMIALAARSGKVLWHTIQTQQAQLVAPHGVYLSVATGKPYHFTYSILALQPATGKQMWTQQL